MYKMASSNSTINTSTSSKGHLRIPGLASGIDVDNIVKQMMSAKKAKLNKLKQKEQLATWKQEAYRSAITAVNEFSEKYFSSASSTSLLHQGNFNKFKANSSDDAITVSTGSTAVKGSHFVTVSRLATAGTQTGSRRLTKDVQGTKAADFTSAQGKSFNIIVDGTKRTVTLDSTVTDVDSLQKAIDSAVGKGKVAVSIDANTSALVFKAVENSGVNQIILRYGSPDALTDLGFGNGAIYNNRFDTSASLESLAGKLSTPLTFNADGELEFAINGAKITVDKSESLDDLIRKVNASKCGATLEYNYIDDKMALTSNELGAGKTIELAETGGNFLQVALDQFNEGTDAQFTVDDVSLTRNSNEFTKDGITYRFNDTTSKKATINITQDTDSIFQNINNFTNDYNKLVKMISGELSEKYSYKYPPLTAEQKEDMSEKEIEAWEAKAKTGILANDPILQGMLDNLRGALVESIDGQSLNIFQIGITQSKDYHDNGKLKVNETKLKEEIAANPEGIMNLFTKQSEKYPGTIIVRKLDSGAREIRYKEEGLAYRFYDFIQDNIGTIRNGGGSKGLLLEKAGMKDDVSEKDNTLTDQLKDYEKLIDAEEDLLEDYEESLYTKYSRLETYISTMNTRLNALASMFSN
jgi:flagellar hook-associated protein 2